MIPCSHALPTSFQGRSPVLPNHVGPCWTHCLEMGGIQPAPFVQVPPGVHWWGNKRKYGISRGTDFIVGSAGRAAKDPKVISFPHRRWNVGCWPDWSQGKKVWWMLGGFSWCFSFSCFCEGVAVAEGNLNRLPLMGGVVFIVKRDKQQEETVNTRWLFYEMLRQVSTLLAGVAPLWFLFWSVLDENRFLICFSYCVNEDLLQHMYSHSFLREEWRGCIYNIQVCQIDPIQIVDKPKLEPEDDGPDRVQLCLAVDQADEAVEVVDGATWTSTCPLGVNRYGTLLWHTATTNQLEGLKVLMHLQPQGPAENSLIRWFVWAQLSLSLLFLPLIIGNWMLTWPILRLGSGALTTALNSWAACQENQLCQEKLPGFHTWSL